MRLGDTRALWRYRSLYEGSRVFREAFDGLCEEAKDVYSPQNLKKCLFAPFDSPEEASPSRVVLMVAMAKMWEQFGVTPTSLTPLCLNGLLAALVINTSIPITRALEILRDQKIPVPPIKMRRTIPLVADDDVTYFTSIDAVFGSFNKLSVEEHLVSFGGVQEDENCICEVINNITLYLKP